MSREFQTVVGSDVIRWASLNKQVAQSFQNIFAGQPPCHIDRQAFPGELIDQCQHPNRSTIMSPAEHELVSPHMVPMLRTEANTRSDCKPQPATLRMLPKYFQVFLTPSTFDSLVVHFPAFFSQHHRNTAISVPTVSGGQIDDSSDKRRLIFRHMTSPTLSRARLTENSTRSTF